MKRINLTKAAKSMMALPIAVGLLPSEASRPEFCVPDHAGQKYAARAPSFLPISDTTISSGARLAIYSEPKALSYAEERRFHKLAIREALGTITESERKEIEALDSRRTVDKPLPADTIIARERLYSKIDELLKKLENMGA